MIHLKGWKGGNFSGIIATSAQKIGAFKMLSCSDHATHRGGTTAMSTLTGVTASYSTVAKMPAAYPMVLSDGVHAAHSVYLSQEDSFAEAGMTL